MPRRTQRTSIPTSEENNVNPNINFNYTGKFNKVIELNPDNYISWKTFMLHLLDSNDLIEYVVNEKFIKLKKNKINDMDNYVIDKINPTLVYSKDIDSQDIKRDNLTKWIILNSLGTQTRKIIEIRGKTAFESWKILEQSFTKGRDQLYEEINNKLNNMKYDSLVDINIFLSSLENLFDELELIEKPLSDENKIGILNRSLPENLRWINVFQYRDDWNKCQQYVTKVIPGIIYSNIKEKTLTQMESQNLLSTETLSKNINKTRTKRKNGKCYICGKFGHYFKRCYKNKNNNNNSKFIKKINKYSNFKNNFKNKNNYKNKNYKNYHNDYKNHHKNYKNYHALYTDKNINHNKHNNNKDIYMKAFTEDFNNECNQVSYIEQNYNDKNKINNNNNNIITVWTIDSGASVHITYHGNLLKNKIPHKEEIFFANGQKVISTHKGDMEGYYNNTKFTLNDVLLIPSFNKNLISVCQLTKQNYKVIFNSYNNTSTVTIYDKNNNKILSNPACPNSNIFKIWIFNNKISNKIQQDCYSCSSADNDNYMIWHRRCGHFQIGKLIQKLPKVHLNEKCNICAKSKLKNKPFHDSKNKTTEIFQLIHMDIIGPISESIYGNKYILTILDDFSRYNWVYFLTGKDKTFDIFKEWFIKNQNIYNKKIKFVKTDNGKEFISNKFHELFKYNGITHLFSTPYTPQQNGRAERLNGVLISCATTLLEDAQLSRRFWEDAVSTASYLYNRIPHKSINNKIPYELLNNQKVNYNNLKVFGCKVVFLIPKPYQQKFSTSGSPGIFIGYCQNHSAYKIFDIVNNKVLISRSIEFFENSPANFYFDKTIENINENELPNNNYNINENELSNNDYNINENEISNNNYKINENISIHNSNINHNNNSNDNYFQQNYDNNNNHNQYNINELYNKNNINNNINIVSENQNSNLYTKENIVNNNSNDNRNFNIENNINNINENNFNMNKHTFSNINNNHINNIPNNNTNININNNNNNNNNSNTYSEYSFHKNIEHNKNLICNNLLRYKRKFQNNNIKKQNSIKKIKTENINNFIEPQNFSDIDNLKDKHEWHKAVQEELKNMENLKVYEVIKKLPPKSNLITTRWIFKYKKDALGNIYKRKARLVARGFTQQQGIDYNETFAPTLKQDSLRIITAIAVQMDFKIIQIDVKAAYLNAPLNEEIYLEAPEGHIGHKKYFWKLNKALYGLKQSANVWNQQLNKVLISLNFKRLHSDPCIYKKVNKDNKITCILAVYVDDIIITGMYNEIKITKELIKKYFNIKEVGDVDFIIGIKFQKCIDGYIIHQKRYITEILEKYDKYIEKPSHNFKPTTNDKLKSININPTQYRSTIGNLLYIAISTRPDILYGVIKAARKSKEPNQEDWNNLIKILEYLKATINFGIKFTKNTNIEAYSDADFGGDVKTRRSTSGFLITIGGTPISWCSKLQHCVATSTCEAEFYSLSECAKQCIWYQNLLNELNLNIKTIKIYVDNKATIQISKNNLINPKSKHIDIRYHFIRELVLQNKIELVYIKSQNNLADGLTKYLNNSLMDKFRNLLLYNFED